MHRRGWRLCDALERGQETEWRKAWEGVPRIIVKYGPQNVLEFTPAEALTT